MEVKIRNHFSISNNGCFTLIAGPCVIESRSQVHKTARELQKISDRLNIDIIFKSSFDKANRSSISSYRGPGLDKGLAVLQSVKDEFDMPVITDFHTPNQAQKVADVVDVLQVPAFLSRQTDMLTAAGETGVPIHVKKGQFLSPNGMKNVVEKIESTGNSKILLCERGALFGYNNLVADMRNIHIMKEIGNPVIFDATHSVQRPGVLGDASGGDRRFAPSLARAAIGVGIAGIFCEVHPNPPEAKCDAAVQLPLQKIESLVKRWKNIDQVVKNERTR